VEVRPTAPADLASGLDRIEAEVEAGNTDLRALEFWPIVARVKLDPASIDAFADQIGRIDTMAFRARVRLRASVWVGNLLLIDGIILGAVAMRVAFVAHGTLLKGLAILVAAGLWSVCVHSPAHWVVGRAIGIRFTDYFLGGPPPPRPGLKTDYGTYLRADPAGRAWFHASGALATKVAPFAALAFWPASGAPWWSAAGLLVLGIGQIVTDVTLSVKASDWKKFRRERAVARSMQEKPPSSPDP
jgi:hypothetical protein